MRLSLLVFCTCAAGALFAPAAGDREVAAGTAVEMSVGQLVAGADLVLEARVVSERGVLDSRGRIETEYLLSVDRTMWGDDRGTRVVRLPGGVVGDRGMLLPGLPRLVPGEDVILMLSAPSDGGLRLPVGLSQGKFRVLTDARGQRSAVRSQTALELLDPRTATVRPADGVDIFEYSALVAEIEAAAATRRALEAFGD